MRRVPAVIRRLVHDEGCVAVVEFALMAPLFVMIFAGVTDIGNALYTWSRLEQALAVGANYALLEYGKITDATLASNVATLASTSNAGSAADARVVVNNGATYTITGGSGAASGSASTSCYCPSGSPGSWTWNSAVACGSTCTDGSLAGKFVTVSVTYSFTPFFPSYGFVAGGAMTAGAAVQTQ